MPHRATALSGPGGAAGGQGAAHRGRRGEVSVASGIQRERLYLTPAGYRLVKVEPGALLEARVTVFDQLTGQHAVRTRTLRVAR